MAPRHSEVKAAIARTCRDLGGVALSKLGTMHEGRGWPDLWLCHARGPRGGFWLEVKVKGDRPRPEQRERAAMIEAAGGSAAFLWERESGEQELRDGDWRLLAILARPAESGAGFLGMCEIMSSRHSPADRDES